MQITTKQIIDLKKPKLKADIIDVLKNRFSLRVFSEEKIKKEDLKKMFEAARWSPSCFNIQPWFFYYAKNGTPGFKRISSSLTEGNSWAKKAPVLIVGCYIDITSHGKNPYAKYDLGQAVFSLVTQAQSLGYYCHQMAGFDKDKIRQDIGIKEPVIPLVAIAVGKIGDYEKADKQIADGDLTKRERKDIINQEI